MSANSQYQYLQESKAHPTQGWGVILSTNEMFYFRYRGSRVSLTILKTQNKDIDENNIAAEFMERIIPLSNPAMPAEVVDAFLNRWITAYLEGSNLRRQLADS